MPVAVFVGLRLSMGNNATSVGYDDGIAPYLFRAWTPEIWADLMMRIVLGLGALWIGIVGLRWNKRLQRIAICYIPLVLLAALLLSSRITRVIGIIYPVIIPGLLYLAEEMTE